MTTDLTSVMSPVKNSPRASLRRPAPASGPGLTDNRGDFVE